MSAQPVVYSPPGYLFFWEVSDYGYQRDDQYFESRRSSQCRELGTAPDRNGAQSSKSDFGACEQASPGRGGRMQSEISLWTAFANKIAGPKRIPEPFEAYTKCVSQRMQMAADDGRKLVEEAQQMTQKFVQSLGNGRLGRTS